MNAARTGALILGLCLVMTGHAAARDDAYAAVREELELCVACHGEGGASSQPEFPILAGQHLYYLYVQLKDFKSGYRKNDEMGLIAAELDKAEMLMIAEYFSEQIWPRIGFRADPAIALKGETAAAAGQCVQCHRGGYEGDSRVPRLAGQHRAYLNQTMLDFKHKVRNNSPAKSTLMTSFGDADIAAMADFLAGF
ncbi:MAG: c-type cytochrome [Proteobacteria bacterium]|nr:c-type cytochrome [Pseudomonadota bacterium]